MFADLTCITLTCLHIMAESTTHFVTQNSPPHTLSTSLLLEYLLQSFIQETLIQVWLCATISLIIRGSMLFCHLSYCTMCVIHPCLVSFPFYTIPISSIFKLQIFYLLVICYLNMCILHVNYCNIVQCHENPIYCVFVFLRYNVIRKK